MTMEYAKEVEGVMLDYMPSDIGDYEGGDFDVRITFGNDSLADAFWVTVPGTAESLTLRQIIDQYVLGVTREDRERIRGSLDITTNPDLPELYIAVRRAFDDVAKGKATLQAHINKGPRDIDLDQPVARHFSRAFSRQYDFDYRLIDLVLDVVDVADAGLNRGQQEESLRQFRAILLLYLMDRFGQDFVFEGRNFDLIGVEAVADWAVMQGWLDLSTKTVGHDIKPVYVRTDEGNKFVRTIVRETDDLIKNYDQFADVTLDEPPQFRTGRGEDLRIAVYRADGLDPLRAAFLMNLENGFYDRNWQQVFAEETFFRELLTVASAPPAVPAQKLERIIRAGKAWSDRNRDLYTQEQQSGSLWRDANRN